MTNSGLIASTNLVFCRIFQVRKFSRASQHLRQVVLVGALSDVVMENRVGLLQHTRLFVHWIWCFARPQNNSIYDGKHGELE